MADIAHPPVTRRGPSKMAALAVAGALALSLAGGAVSRQATVPAADMLSMDGLSASQLDSLIRHGRTVAIIPLGRSDPADVTRVARMLGNALIAPSPAGGSLESAARELKQRGFRAVAFLGEGENGQGAVAEKLNREWRGHRVRVVNLAECCGAGEAPQSVIDAAVTRIRRIIGRIDA